MWLRARVWGRNLRGEESLRARNGSVPAKKPRGLSKRGVVLIRGHELADGGRSRQTNVP